MRGVVIHSLKQGLEPTVVADIFATYDEALGKFRRNDAKGALNAAGLFVEHVLRAIEHLRTGVLPAEIKSVASTLKDIEKDCTLPESLRVLVPRILSAMAFDVRSKRGAAHVKEISPRFIDAALAVQALSWTMAELVRLFHVADESDVANVMAALMRGSLPLIEKIDDEVVINTPLHPEVEVLLMVAEAEPDGIDRKGLGLCVKHSPTAVTRAVQKLEDRRHIHKTKNGAFRLLGSGEQALVEQLATVSRVVVPNARSSA